MSRPGALAQELGVVRCLWRREMMRLARERMRWAVAVVQPLLFWLIIGTGMASTFRLPGADDVSSLTFFFPGMLAMIVLFTTIFTTITIVDDRQHGFLQAVLVAPGSRAALVAGKLAGVTTLTLLQCLPFVLLAPLAGYPARDVRWGLLLLVIAVTCVGLTAMNFTVAWILDSIQSYHAVMSVLLIPLWFLSGALFPAPDGWLGALMALDPLTYAVDALRASLAGSEAAAHAGARGLSTCLAVLCGFAAATFTIATASCSGWRPRR